MGRTLESLGGRVLDPGPFTFARLPLGTRQDLEVGYSIAIFYCGGDVAAMRRQARFRLVEVPLRRLRPFAMVPLRQYDEFGEPKERARTEQLIKALRTGATLPPLVLMVAPFAYHTRPIELLDGYHRVTALTFLGRPVARAFELILPPDHLLRQPPKPRAIP